MRIYEASLAYSIVQLGPVTAINTPDKIVDYLHDAYDRNPVVETFWVISLDADELLYFPGGAAEAILAYTRARLPVIKRS